jgi:hypothetical protein
MVLGSHRNVTTRQNLEDHSTETEMEPSVTMMTADFPIYETNAEENEWQEAP